MLGEEGVDTSDSETDDSASEDEQVCHEGQKQKSFSFAQERSIREVTEEDMLHKLFVQEEHGHDEYAGRVVCSWEREQESALER